MRILNNARVGAVALCCGLSASVVQAAPDEAISLEEDTEEAATTDESSEIVEPEEAPSSSEPASEVALADGSPVEQPGETYYFVGARYRGIVLPKFMMNMFADGGTTVYANSFGAEFGIRKDNFEIIPSLWYADYGMDPTPFKAKSDGADAWELVESNMKVLFISADFLWSQPFTPELALTYGAGAGFGIVFGDITRTEAYGATDADGTGSRPCIGPNNPAGPACPTDGHYGAKEPSWADGGSRPILFPWLVAQTGLRYKPHRNFVARLDVGFGTSGFFFGLGANYGL